MLWLKSLERLSLCEKGRRCSLFCIVVCLPSHMHSYTKIYEFMEYFTEFANMRWYFDKLKARALQALGLTVSQSSVLWF